MEMDSRSQQISFLDLPQSVRVQIYHLFRLLRPCPIDFSDEPYRISLSEVVVPNNICTGLSVRWNCTYLKHRADPKAYLFGSKKFECYGPRIPLELFRINKRLHHEAFSLFYSLNKFQLRSRLPSDLQILQNLSPSILSSLTSLYIDFGIVENSKYALYRPRRSAELLSQWNITAETLARCVTNT